MVFHAQEAFTHCNDKRNIFVPICKIYSKIKFCRLSLNGKALRKN